MSIQTLEQAIGTNRVLIVNSAMEIKETVSWQRAVTMIFDEKGYTLLARPGEMLRSPSFSIEKPLVVCLNKYVRRFERVYNLEDEVTKTYVRQRDGYICQYCGNYGDTVDHVYPYSRGGKNTWGNLVTACKPCNGFKDDRTPEEAGMVRPVIKSGVVQPARLRDIQDALSSVLVEMSAAS